MTKADWTGGSIRRSPFEKLKIQLCAVALCAAGAVAGPAAASTLNTIDLLHNRYAASSSML
jgi:hypothetical protein